MFNGFLKECRKLVARKEPLCLVLGNDSCDLDSAVSSICLAHFMHKNVANRFVSAGTKNVVPVLNIRRAEFPLKTEITYFFRRNDIDPENLIFSDEITESLLEASKLILVDHHVSPYRNNVIGVIDHRPFDTNAQLPTDCALVVDEVGSCATLVADLLRTNITASVEENRVLFALLYGAIVLDTVNFSKEADRACALDVELTAYIETQFTDCESSLTRRQTLFTNLVAARSDVGSLDSLQILSKDLKIVSNKSGTVIVSIPGFPILVQEYVKKPDAVESVRAFGALHKCDSILLMGMQISGVSVQRDVGLINIKNGALTEQIDEALTSSSKIDLQLVKHRNCAFMNGIFYSQGNVKASRKQILPILKGIIDNK